MGKIKSIFNIHDNRELKQLEKIVVKIENLEDEISRLSDESLKLKTEEFKKRLKNGETLDDILPEAFAVVREASKRVLNMRQYKVQLMGGIVLHQSKIAQMKTGEGKTLVAVAPVYLNALTEKGVHVVTVNDYLAKRDKELMEPIYNFLGLSVGVILNGQEGEERKLQYDCDITYGTNNEFGFDYLRDNMEKNKEDVVQRELNYAIVDEIDSILIDEARTPLIISGQINIDEKSFRLANTFIKILLPEDYDIKEKEKTVNLTDQGIKKAEIFYKVDNLMDLENIEIYHHINQALKANFIMKRDVDYVVKDGKIEIIDEFTGRIMEGRRFSEGLHQSIEAKEYLEIKNESKTLATITYQNFFRSYNKLSGMTGTAKTDEKEFESIYKMNVVEIPTNKPVIRKDLEEKVYTTEVEKFKAIVLEVEKVHNETKQPILIGTSSIKKSEMISYLLSLRKLNHNVLNAKNHEEEASIIKDAGKLGAITVATNMAGRGTDIKLGEGVDKLGGLYVIGSEKHENRRVDNQLRGRCGRQGDPGVSRFFVSLEDDLIKHYGSKKIEKIKEKNRENSLIEEKNISDLIEKSQIALESRNFEIRKEVLKYDDVINEQRKIIYSIRKEILNSDDCKEIITKIIFELIDYGFNNYIKIDEKKEGLCYIKEEYNNYIKNLFNMNDFTIEDIDIDDVKLHTKNVIIDIYNKKSDSIENIRLYEKDILLSLIDRHWVEHLDEIEQLKKVVPFQAVAQKDPVKYFISEAYDIFEKMNYNIKYDIVKHIFNI